MPACLSVCLSQETLFADDLTVGVILINFPEGSTTAAVNVSVVDDFLIEENEQFNMTLRNPSVGSVSSTNGFTSGLIIDNDSKSL